jgi:hypothetical protein
VNRQRFSFLQTIPILAVLCASTMFAQEMHQHAPPVPSKSLTVRSGDGKTLTLNPQELAALPHKSVAVFNAHTKANETYSGVSLASLLDRVGAPLGEKVHGPVLMTGVVAEGTDGYKVLFALAEVDTAFHNGDVIVADSVDGHPLGEDGAFKLVSTEDKHPARWVRNLTAISVFNAKP